MSKPKKSMKHKKRSQTRQGRTGPKRVVNLGLIVPDKVLVNMPYGEMIERTPGSVTDLYTFRMNSTFDPDLTGTGHQPLGRDQFAGVLYGKYRVHSIKVEVFFSEINSAACPCLHYIYPSNGYSLSTITDALEQPNVKYRVAGDPNYGFGFKLGGSWKLWDIWGKTREQYLSDDLTGSLYNANPNEVFTLDIGLGTMDRTTSVTKWRFAIRLDYLVEWYDRVLIGAS